jgi:threonine synthase
VIGRGERVVAVLTGHLLKDPDAGDATDRGSGTDAPLEAGEALALLERVITAVP